MSKMSRLNGNRGMFIALEGIDGCGKTTLAKMLADSMSKEATVYLTREPWQDDIRQRIYQSKCSKEGLFLFMADRAKHVEEAIQPAIDHENVVITDRYMFSNAAYQGYTILRDSGERPSDEWQMSKMVNQILEMNCNLFPYPDHVFIIDIPVDVALERIRKSGREIVDAFERIDVLEAVRENFLYIGKSYMNITVIDGTQSSEEMLKVVLDIIADKAKLRP